MTVQNKRRAIDLPLALLACVALCASGAADAKAKPGASAKRPPDLADLAQGSYFGDVISDARGASRSDVRITVAKIGSNKVRISSDYPRLPPFTAALTRAMQTIQNAGGSEVFLLDLSKHPTSLDVTVDDASWSGAKE